MNYQLKMTKDRKTERQKDIKAEIRDDKNTERKIEGMTKRQNGRKTESPCRDT